MLQANPLLVRTGCRRIKAVLAWAASLCNRQGLFLPAGGFLRPLRYDQTPTCSVSTRFTAIPAGSGPACPIV